MNENADYMIPLGCMWGGVQAEDAATGLHFRTTVLWPVYGGLV